MNNPELNSDNSAEQRKAALEKLEKHYRETMSEEEIQEALDIVREVRTRGRSQRRTWRDDWGEVFEYFALTRLWRKLALGTGALTLCVALLAMLLWNPAIEIQTSTRWQSASSIRLPDILRFRFGKPDASLEGRQFALAGQLGRTTRSGSSVTAMEATFNGTNEDGTTIRFLGTLVLTNAPGVVNVRSRHDFVGACLIGELTVGTNAPIFLEQPYLH